jgi:hypothetical protein
MSELSSPPITLAVLAWGYTNEACPHFDKMMDVFTQANRPFFCSWDAVRRGQRAQHPLPDIGHHMGLGQGSPTDKVGGRYQDRKTETECPIGMRPNHVLSKIGMRPNVFWASE